MFELELRRAKGFEIRRMSKDGNCLFRAVADQVYGDAEAYDMARQMCVDYMVCFYFFFFFLNFYQHQPWGLCTIMNFNHCNYEVYKILSAFGSIDVMESFFASFNLLLLIVSTQL